MKHLIIGGVAGGATAAARIRRADENAEIILIEKDRKSTRRTTVTHQSRMPSSA